MISNSSDYDDGGNKIDPDVGKAKSADEEPARKSAATVLVEQAVKLYDLGVSADGEPYALPRTGPRLVRMLRGSRTSLRAQLAREYFTATGKAAPQQALADALLVLEGQALDCDPKPPHLRVADHGGRTYLDLGDSTGRAVEVDATGWRIVDFPPVLFRRVLTAPLPEPARGGGLAGLWELLNVAQADRPLVLAWLVAAMAPEIPHPILGLFGEQGVGKTTAAKVLALLLDPTSAPVRKAPRDAESWITAASGSWCVALDNLSMMPDWLSDALCRAVTGDGDVRRRLYTDGELFVFAFRRCLIVTGIDLGAVRGDFADRLLPVDLHLIGEHDRAEEHDLWAGWADRHALLLGALLDLAASVKAVAPSVRLASRPRMADFARVLAAVDIVCDTKGLDRYREKAGELAVDSLTGDPFVTSISTAISEKFTGTSAELLALVTPKGEEPWRAPKGWPANPRAVTQLLRRQAPVMRRAGWSASELPAGHANALRWELTPPPPREARKQGSQGSQRSQPASDASEASHEYGPTQDDGRPTGAGIGPCSAGCDRTTRKYGDGSTGPLCAGCRAAS